MTDETNALDLLDAIPEGGAYLQRPVLVEVPGLRRHHVLALHIGQVMLEAASLDAALTDLIAVLKNREEPDRDAARGRFIRQKLDLLRTAYPSTWRDTEAFTRALRRVTVDRNSLAHAFWGVDIDSLEPVDGEARLQPQLVLATEKSSETKPVDFEELHKIHVDTSLLSILCRDIAFEWVRGSLPPDLSVHDYAKKLATDPLYIGWSKSEHWLADVERVFHSGE